MRGGGFRFYLGQSEKTTLRRGHLSGRLKNCFLEELELESGRNIRTSYLKRGQEWRLWNATL